VILPPVSHLCDSTDRIPIFLSGILPRVSPLRDSIGIVVRAIGSKPELYRVGVCLRVFIVFIAVFFVFFLSPAFPSVNS
jgi:hypothetical protein